MTTAPDPAVLMLAGDWHGNAFWARRVIAHAASLDVDTILQLGDFGYWVDDPETDAYLAAVDDELRTAGIRLFWLDGNHEDHTRRAEWGDPARYPNLTYLPRGFRWNWWGRTWMSVGGATSVDKRLRVEGESWWPGEELTDADVEHAMREGDVDVIVSHDCPRGVDIPGVGPDTKSGVRGNWPPDILEGAQRHRDKLAQICRATQPSRLFHGHYHIGYTGTLDCGAVKTTEVVGLADDRSTINESTLVLTPGES
jgi:Calcineurin-like phosphoesterase